MNTLPELQAESRRLASEQRELRDKIKAKGRAEARARWEAEKAAQDAEIEAVKAEFAERYSLPRNAKFDHAWDIAWDHGHSSGMDEVRGFFDELIELIRP